MDDIELDEGQATFYQEIFLHTTAGGQATTEGKVSIKKANNVFHAAELPEEVIREITLLVGVPQTALFLSKRQFFSCLKLISAYQAKIPMREELLTSNLVPLPLPRFNWKTEPSVVNNHQPNGVEKKQWIEVRSPDLIHLRKEQAMGSDVATSDQADSEVDDVNASTASDSPTPTNSVIPGDANRPWAKGAMWLCSEEQRQLLGTEEESSDRHSSDEDHEIDLETVYQITPEQKEYYVKQFRSIQPDFQGLLSGQNAKIFFEKSRIPVDELRLIWQLCDVTRDGALSLEEFTAAMHLVVLRRNNIPIPVVLPTCLTQMLLPEQQTKKEAPEGDLLHLEDDNDNNIAENQAQIDSNYKRIISNADTKPNFVKITSPKKPPPPRPSSEGSQEQSGGSDKKESWTKFPESPTSSNVSSPGPKPVNFDIQKTTQAIVSDPQILHPVALRVTPEVIDEEPNRRKTTDPSLVYEAGVIIRENANQSPAKVQSTIAAAAAEIRPIQRPQPKTKMSSRGSIPPPPQREPSLTHTDSVESNQHVAVKKDPPPTPPPRIRGHVRSSSLDLKKLKMGTDPPSAQPHLQPMASYDGYECSEPSSFADFTQFPNNANKDERASADKTTKVTGDFVTTIKLDSSKTVETPKPLPRVSVNSLIANRTSAFEVYQRKPTASSRNSQSPVGMDNSNGNHTNNSSIERYEKRVIAISDNLRLIRIQPGETMSDVLRHLKEQNHLLLKVCTDLSEELLEVQSRKEDLRLKLESILNQKSN